MENSDERRKKFFPHVTLGNLLTIFAIALGGIGLYTQVIADNEKNKLEISNLKANEAKREATDKELRAELKADVREVKNDVRDLNQKVDKILQELLRQRR